LSVFSTYYLVDSSLLNMAPISLALLSITPPIF
jgi:hypothetical protein